MRPTVGILVVALLTGRLAWGQPLTLNSPPAAADMGPAAVHSMPAPNTTATPEGAATKASESAASSPAPEHLLRFDPQAAEIRWVDNHWQLQAGGIWLKDFRRDTDAREALRIIRELNVNERGTLGTPQPILEYWLSNGQPLPGHAFGLHLLPVEVATLRAEKVQGQWIIRDAHRLFFVFGAHGDEARQALDVIRRHGFTQIGYVGQPNPEMIYFVGSPDSTYARMTAPAPIVPRRSTNPGQEATNPPAAPGQPDALPAAGPANSGVGVNPLDVQRTRQLATVIALANDRPAFGDRVSFDAHQLKVQADGQDWKLTFGDYTVADFGPYPSEARRALNVLQFYRCSEKCLVGQSHPSFSFFLSNGQAPRGTMFGLSGTTFRPDALVIREYGNGWAICDRDRPLIPLGDKLDDARQLLTIMRQQKFNYLSHVGPAPYGMNILLRTQ